MSDELLAAHAAYEAGQFDQAATLYKKLQDRPWNQTALTDLATMALHGKSYKDALDLAAQCVSKQAGKPELAHLHGLCLLQAGLVEDARAALERAVSLAPEDNRIANTYGHALLAAGQTEYAAQHFYRSAQANAGTPDYWQDLAHALGALPVEVIRDRYAQALIDCLNITKIKPKNAAIQARKLIKPFLTELHQHLINGEFQSLQDWLLAKRASKNYQVFVALIENVRCTDAFLENALTELRAMLLNEWVTASKSAPIAIVTALATQCFLTDYAFTAPQVELEQINGLRSLLRNAIDNQASVNSNAIALYATYHPLHTLQGVVEVTPQHDDSAEVSRWGNFIVMHVSEPLTEYGLRGDIPSLTQIENETSRAVQQQYEESPYPRWTGVNWGGGKLPIGFRQSTPSPKNVSGENGRHRILIAGCGTGQQAAVYSLAQPQASITAFDLSRRSLAYGERKKREFGLQNVTFHHGDILRLPETNLVFDEIACAGVLHHLKTPRDGLSALKKVYSGKGEFNLQVYTESGRQAVVAGIALRDEHGYKATAGSMREFRKRVYGLSDSHPAKGLLRFADFFSLFECRDLVFNVQEHRYTLITLSHLLNACGFVFSGLKISTATLATFRRLHPNPAAVRDPARWQALEDSNPSIFGSMYNVMARLAS
ncbi:MAG: methyltransferase domain-containing protein [Rhodospirillaceae bacterium]|jgi:SAM-dependent methyltransferase/tetratricopeptide (TPR) repeat protein|nr:methyltransferase domain-containing protein [Rhodospirillaceae bacterium]